MSVLEKKSKRELQEIIENVRFFLRGQNSKVPEEFVDYQIQRVMGWDYYTYLKQPDEWLILISEFIKLEAEENGRYK